MNVVSLGFRTDLALLERAGSTIEDCGDHLVVRTPSNPTFYWGNFLLIDHVPAADGVEMWLDRFADALPAAPHRSFGFDAPHAVAADLVAFADHGLDIDVSTVMTATSVHAPAHPNGEASYRAFESDADWARSIELTLACNDEYEPVGHRTFVERRVAGNRALVEAGHGSWFGAFLDGVLVSQMGLVTAGPALARFQLVETHPGVRGRGLAGTLVHHVSRYGFDTLGAETLVMVADPDYLAIRLYRSVGFSDSESQLQVERKPSETRAS
jgi:ribosomal protein S18 acetylase RimI-like enzyme